MARPGRTLARACARTEFVATSEKASPAVNACRADGNATASAGLAFPIYRAAEQDLDRPERHYDSDDPITTPLGVAIGSGLRSIKRGGPL